MNNYFASKAETTTKNTKKKNLDNKSGSKIFLQPTDKEEITNIISSLNSNKPSGPISIPHEISKQLPELFKYSFMAGLSPSALKTPTFKKDSKLDFSNYPAISLLSNNRKILERLMYKRLHIFLSNNNNNNNIIYKLQ